MIKKIIFFLGIVFIAIQFYPRNNNNVAKNNSTYSLALSETTSDSVLQILKTSCYDCHSNRTIYPWYANIQPVGFWLNHHINDGKKHLNFSTFLKKPIAVQNHKLEEVAEQVEEKEMPMPSYTYLGLHGDANLTNQQREVLIKWAKSQMAMLKATYPADSLKMKPRPKS